MWRERVRDYLLPGRAERDQSFSVEIERVATQSLLLVGFVQIAIPFFMMVARFLVAPESASLPLHLRQAAFVAGIGISNLGLSRVRGIGRWGRLIACVSALLCSGVLIWASMVVSSQSTNPNDFIPGQITLVMLVAVTTVPLLPLQTLGLGLAMGVEYFIAATVAEHRLMEGLGPDDNYLLFIVMLTLLCTGLTAVLYAQRRSNHQVLQQTVEAAEALRQAQTRIMLTESAASLSRLAATVSHEMNNPLGALLSGVETLLLLAGRQATCSPAEQPRLLQMQADIRKSMQQSAERLKELVARMQRFTYLDQAEVQPADVNALIRDVAALFEATLKAPLKLELHLDAVRPVVCNPQQISIALSSLINNALKAVNGDGRIVVSSRQSANEVEVDIEDNGSGISPEQRQSIFDPGFRVAHGRIATGNWSMFHSRQIVREIGGDIRITSSQGRGTRITVTLPSEEGVGA